MAKKKLAIRHRNKRGQFSKRGKRERVYSHAKTILRRIAKEERARKKREKEKKAPPPSNRPQDFLVTFQRDGYDDVSFQVVAFEENEALDFIRTDLLDTDNGKKLLKAFRPVMMPFHPPRYRSIEDLGYIGEREEA